MRSKRSLRKTGAGIRELPSFSRDLSAAESVLASPALLAPALPYESSLTRAAEQLLQLDHSLLELIGLGVDGELVEEGLEGRRRDFVALQPDAPELRLPSDQISQVLHALIRDVVSRHRQPRQTCVDRSLDPVAEGQRYLHQPRVSQHVPVQHQLPQSSRPLQALAHVRRPVDTDHVVTQVKACQARVVHQRSCKQPRACLPYGVGAESKAHEARARRRDEHVD
eukprot:763932-Hanusia_phi.AAC.3